jgi:hypothetical protein
MIVVPPPGADFPEPWRARESAAEGLLDLGVDENAVDHGEVCGCLQQMRVLRGPALRVQGMTVGCEHGRHVERVALLDRERTPWAVEPEPDVDIQAVLMAAMSIGGRAASGLPHVPNAEHPQTTGGHDASQILYILHERRVAGKASTLVSHDLETLPFGRAMAP